MGRADTKIVRYDWNILVYERNREENETRKKNKEKSHSSRSVA